MGSESVAAKAARAPGEAGRTAAAVSSGAVRLALLLIDLSAIALPAWYFHDTVSLAYAGMIALVQPFIFRENSLYWRHGGVYRTYWLQAGQLARSYFVIFVLFCIYAFLTQAVGARPHPDALLVLFAAVVVLNTAARLGFTALLRLVGVWKAERYVVVGVSPRARLIAEQIRGEPQQMAFLGYVAERSAADMPEGVAREEVLGSLDELEEVVRRLSPDHVIVVLDEFDTEDLLGVCDRVARLPTVGFVYNETFNVVRQRYKSRRIGGYTVTAIESTGRRSASAAAKRLTDVAGAGLLLLLFSPLFLLIALLIKATSKGPVFFVSERVKSRTGETFKFYKFRSMYVTGADHEALRREGIERSFTGAVLDTEHTKVTPKGLVTPVGRFLRRASLDELPQLINVLKGDMSLVGPRPCLPYEFAKYRDWHKRRLDGKPGITGLWQIVGRSRTTFDEQVILDIYYLGHQTIWFDVEILLKTVPVVLLGKGGG